MERVVSEQDIRLATGNDRDFLQAVYEGLMDVSLKGMFPYLNLDEALKLAAGSWFGRNDPEFCKQMKRLDLVEIFDLASNRRTLGYSSVDKWLYEISGIEGDRYNDLNPHDSILEKRIIEVPLDVEIRFRNEMSIPVMQKPVDADTYNVLQGLRGDLGGCVRRFYFTGNVERNLIEGITRIFGTYPAKVKHVAPDQLELFEDSDTPLFYELHELH